MSNIHTLVDAHHTGGVGGGEMKSIVKGGRAIIANDDGYGVVAVKKFVGGLIVVKDPNGILIYRGHSKERAARQIDITLQMNKSTKRLPRQK